MVSSTPRPHFTPGKDPVPILQEAGWARGPVWTGGKSRLHRDSIPDLPARSQTLYRLSYPDHTHTHTHIYIYIYIHTLNTSAMCYLRPKDTKIGSSPVREIEKCVTALHYGATGDRCQSLHTFVSNGTKMYSTVPHYCPASQ